MLTIVNDTHIGAIRSGGTTGASQLSLKQHIRHQFKALLPQTGDLMILGDLFDKVNVALDDLLFAHDALNDWLDDNENNATLYLVAGNHDLCKTSGVISSFDLLCALLSSCNSNIVVIKDGLTLTPYGYVIPHMPCQELFDAELAKVPECTTLFVHCNIMSPFAAHSDQSLNMSKAQIDACLAETIVCAHEHNARTVGKVLIPGNQIATSVSDWVNSSSKGMLVWTDGVFQQLRVRGQEEEYAELDWMHLTPTSAKFIRIIGAATPEQAAQVVSAIAKYRAASPALVITNAVAIGSNEGTDAFSTSLEAVTAFSVWGALREFLEPSEIETLESLT